MPPSAPASPQVRIALPNKGRLAEQAASLLRQAGVLLEPVDERRLFATAAREEFLLMFVRAADIPEFVQDGVADGGITGHDIVRESRRDLEQLMDLRFGKCELVLAVPEDSAVRGVADVPKGARVATVFPNLTREFFAAHQKDVTIVEVSGATEVTPHIGVAEMIVDLSATGSTLKVNHMRPVATILQSTARLVANKASLRDAAKGARLRELAWVLQSVVEAKGKHYVMANVPRARLADVNRIMPGISGPTIVELGSRPDFV
ncbi:MAG TPA: ATP phosphoribosyltransferase, partial [Candidatus Thermoplasmatota archaeon]|nr:ATP phosphoribosyltransferase [Candidatus Thermoplasmatota archaeon]